ncbi:MAG TPA: N-6 DNA methylase, partial [Smithella sp.]|nr:N-6 DNA methylase [Smithella sp.]
MPAPQIILELIERFERNIESYKSNGYNETQVRREFIDPFFEALGWDVNNTAGHAEAYKDVIHEDAVKVSGVTKAPDYSFRIGGQRKFFVEAKKPSVNLKDAPAAAFQVRRYAWSAKLPLSIVTDFEEFAVYDCRIKPDQKDKSDKARITYYSWRQYADKWDEIAAVFSKDVILKGSFDKYAESSKAKRGTSEVDNAFLAEIESWRDALARNIALRNTLSVRELNDAVQRTIDRIIFLRIAEDRGIEDYGSLRSLCNGANIYGRLQELFYKADDRYNSGLFHFRNEKDQAEPPDNLTTKLTIDDKPLKEILTRLYYPDSPYEFSVLPADILGQVYEQFLGKVIRLTSDHRAVVEDKPEVKKAGGVFYTPTYIVDYIVKNTVGKLLEGKNPKTAEKLRILDPACGSGSFLLGAYQCLLDWHLQWYTENDPEKHAKAKRPILYKGYGDTWHLTTAERKRILLNNIYGVDIDIQAVEVTKLSLLLKVLEDETSDTLNRQRVLFHERALPNLGNNIKCGNSLIGPDFYNGKQMTMLDTEEAQRVNVFDWQTEFPEIFKAGGFDAVIGNPPYGAMLSKIEHDHICTKFVATTNDLDTFALFMEKSVNLLKQSGRLSMIVPTGWYSGAKFSKLRRFIAQETDPEYFINLPYDIFNAWVDTTVFVFEKR